MDSCDSFLDHTILQARKWVAVSFKMLLWASKAISQRICAGGHLGNSLFVTVTAVAGRNVITGRVPCMNSKAAHLVQKEHRLGFSSVLLKAVHLVHIDLHR